MTMTALPSRRRRGHGPCTPLLSLWPAGIPVILCSSALAQEQAPAPSGAETGMTGIPHNWQIWHQPPATPIMEELIDFHGLLVTIITGITLLVIIVAIA